MTKVPYGAERVNNVYTEENLTNVMCIYSLFSFSNKVIIHLKFFFIISHLCRLINIFTMIHTCHIDIIPWLCYFCKQETYSFAKRQYFYVPRRISGEHIVAALSVRPELVCIITLGEHIVAALSVCPSRTFLHNNSLVL